MRHAFNIDGSIHDLWLARAGAGYRLDMDGSSHPVMLEPLGGHRFALSVGGDRTIVHIVVDGDDVHVQVDGAARVARFLDPVKRFADEGSQASEDVARAPMPGVAIAIAVAPGQPVAAGDPLLVIESMKLETAIRAWRDGEIEAVHVAAGQSFDRGAPLLALKKAGA